MINRVVLVGRLTRDVELRYTGSGDAVASFTIAVERNFTNRAGEREADFISCVIWRKAAENFANFTGKGAMVGIEGRLQTRNYDNNQGQKVYVTEVVVDNFQLLETRAQSEARRSQNGTSPAANNVSAAPQQNQNNFKIPAQQANPFDSQFNNQSQSSSANSNQSSAASPFNTDAGNDSLDISDDDLPF